MGALHLIRHGQASWGAQDYDQLSPLGVQQGSLLGTAWEAGDWAPAHCVAGSLKRHAQTAVATIDACGQGDGYDVDGGWDEYDVTGLLDALARRADGQEVTPREFQPLLDAALGRWVAGEDELGTSFEQWSGAVRGALDRAIERAAGKGEQVAVFTSGGPIGLVVSHLLTGDDSLFVRLNAVVVNSSVTTVIVGSTGPRLLTFNEHGHLPRDLVTFR
ncbi:histidine phosphatase family protein [Aeromicrobium sp. CF4.19]|uniref:histidine phosphatase family protein n=1 Tax=Aeromicrobium sp. CF4.19 TaxID=3373082 RepID=UPI003EE7AE02